ncbi:MAG: DMT family transporter [Alphaproteobacteria bacterium]|nr:DMT family transporter [Alphaproteobacteria bacterium SS10]
MAIKSEENSVVSRQAALLLFVSIMILWGVNWPIMKVGLDGIPPLTFGALRCVMGAACFFALNPLIGRMRLPPRADWPVVFSVGALQIAAFQVFIYLGLEHVPAGRSSMVAYTTPLWVVPGAILLLGEAVNRTKLLGLFVGLAGLAALFTPWALDWSDRSILIGHFWLVLGAVSWAMMLLHVRKHRWESSPLELAPWQFLVASLISVPIALTLEADRSIDWTTQTYVVLAYNGPIATAFCIWAAVTVSRALPASTTSLTFLGVPVVGVMSSALTLGEPLGLFDLAGLALIGGGLLLVARADRHGERDKPKDAATDSP